MDRRKKSPFKYADKVEQTCTTDRGNSNRNVSREKARLLIGLSRKDRSPTSNAFVLAGQMSIMKMK